MQKKDGEESGIAIGGDEVYSEEEYYADLLEMYNNTHE